MSNITKGKYGEDLAVKYLQENGYKILERNFRYSKYGEIDIIASKNLTLIALEVKTRTGLFFGAPEEAVGQEKLGKIYKCLQYYMEHKKGFYLKYRIDVIAIVLDSHDCNIFEIKHIKNLEI